MAVKIIRVFEHGILKVGQEYAGVKFTQRHFDALSRYMGRKSGDEFDYYSIVHNGIKFKQHVGVICLDGLQIEVLPKADKGNDDKAHWSNCLLQMLKTIYKLRLNVTDNAHGTWTHSQILDVFVEKFLDETEVILHKGLIKTYRRVDENCTALKGKLIFSKQLTKNLVHQERFYVNHTVYDRNHICNRILYKTLRLIPEFAVSSGIRTRAINLAFNFPELEDVNVTDTTFDSLAYDRKMEDYRGAMMIARMILLHYLPNFSSDSRRDSVLALMFDMNKLWEEYVYCVLRRKMTGYKVLPQRKKMFWKSDDSSGSKKVIPDIVVINKDNEPCAVLDTKWKLPEGHIPGDADLKQMYVYHKFWKVDKTALIYPATGDSETYGGHFMDPDGTTAGPECAMIFLNIDSQETEGTDKPKPMELDISRIADFVEKDTTTAATV